MIKHNVQTPRDNVTYYFHCETRYKEALDTEYGDRSNRMIQNAHSAYDEDACQFVKQRDVGIDVMNAMLLIKRFERKYGRLSPEQMDMIESHV